MSAWPVHVDLNVRRYSCVIEEGQSIVLVTQNCKSVGVHQSPCDVRSGAEGADLETVLIFIELQLLLKEFIV